MLPAAVLMPKFESLTAVTDLHSKLLREAEIIDGQPGYVSVVSVRRLLKMSSDAWNVVFNVLDSLSCRSQRRGWHLCSQDGDRIELHTLSLFLFMQIYGKQASKRADYELQDSKKEILNTRGMAPRTLSTLTFSSFMRKHLQTLLYLIKDNPPELTSTAWCLPRSSSPGVAPSPLNQDPTRGTIWISAEEVDRLELLLCARPAENGSGIRAGNRSVPGVSSCLSCFKSHRGTEMARASCVEVATCLRASVMDTESDADVTESSGRVCGMTKGTLVLGEDSFPDDQLIIHECQDSCIYALAPLARAKVTACSDCIIILGPTSGCVMVENCTRVKLIYAATSTCITACHESTLHLATIRSPYVIGDNRFLQLAPYNIEYERLVLHLERAGLDVRQNLWDRPVVLNLSKEHGKEEESSSDSASIAVSTSQNPHSSEQSIEDLLLPPDQLLPFTIPFRGGPGPLAGGAPTNSQISWVNRLGSGTGNGPPFALSPLYANALTCRLRKVAELQESVGKAISDLNNRRDIQVAIQRYFKEWLFKTAKIRQVYDLAKLEQQMISESKSTNAPSSNSNSQ